MLVRLQGIDAGLRLDEAKARGVARRSQPQARRIAERAGADDRAALRAAARDRRRLAHGRGPGEHQAETSRQNVNTARASLAEARAQLALAEKAVADVVVAAPVSGLISERPCRSASTCSRRRRSSRSSRSTRLRLQLTSRASRPAMCPVGQTVTATVDAFPGQSFTGRITAVNPAISRVALVPRRGARPQPGRHAQARHVRRRARSTRAGRRGRCSCRARGHRGREHELVPRVRRSTTTTRRGCGSCSSPPRQSGDTRAHSSSGVKEGERVATSNLADLDTVEVGRDSRTSRSGHSGFRRNGRMQKLAEDLRPPAGLRHDAHRGAHRRRRRVVLHARRRPLPARRDAGRLGQTTNPGATPESIETEITDRIEAAVNTVAGIDELRSTSTEGRSRVTISFDLSKNPDVAAQEVRAKVDPVIRDLPETADPPVVQKQDPDSMPIMMFSVSAPMPVVELTTYLEQNVQKRLESVNGVGEVLLFGARRREIQVQIDPDRLNAYGLSTTDVAGGAARAEPRAARRTARAGRARAVGAHGRPAAQRRRTSTISSSPRAATTPIRIRDIGARRSTPARMPTSVSILNGTPGGDGRRPQAERRQHRRAGRRDQGAHGGDSADAAAELRGPAGPRRLGVHQGLARRHRRAPGARRHPRRASSSSSSCGTSARRSSPPSRSRRRSSAPSR